ncbi:hypothetical protein SESBI_33052 [Sesbania bispinosa]|nr:hypothetical protein SESBI_33052 [Sesbania bispinosa]
MAALPHAKGVTGAIGDGGRKEGNDTSVAACWLGPTFGVAAWCGGGDLRVSSMVAMVKGG